MENQQSQPDDHGGRLELVRVVAPHFVAGFLTDGVVRRAAPILKYMVGWDDAKVRAYIARKGWKASRLLGPFPVSLDRATCCSPRPETPPT